jgi:RimJ/RimL family protein N-acetyltransferase
MVKLVTDRLVLRPLEIQDAQAIASEINDFEIARNLARVPFPYERHHAEDFIAWTRTLDARSKVFAVEKKTEPGALIGIVSYEWSDTKQNAEMGYWLARRVWGIGIATEAGHAAVTHAFDSVGHTELVSHVHADNIPSHRVLTKLGFEDQGMVKHFSTAQNAIVPAIAMQLSRLRWQARNASFRTPA